MSGPAGALAAATTGLGVLVAGATMMPRPRRVGEASTRPPLAPASASASASAPTAATATAAAVPALAEALDGVVRELRTGTSLAAALGSAAAAPGSALDGVASALRRGATVEHALRAATPATPDELLVVQALRAVAMAGGDTAPTLERAAAVLRERASWRDERRVAAAQAVLSARVLTLVPPAFGLWTFAGGDGGRALAAHPLVTGGGVAVGVALNLAGWLWMRRLVKGAP